jgi:hypothetical protein
MEGRVQGVRALCRFATLPESKVLALDLALERGGWRFEDVRTMDAAEYDQFGQIEANAGTAVDQSR